MQTRFKLTQHKINAIYYWRVKTSICKKDTSNYKIYTSSFWLSVEATWVRNAHVCTSQSQIFPSYCSPIHVFLAVCILLSLKKILLSVSSL